LHIKGDVREPNSSQNDRSKEDIVHAGPSSSLSPVQHESAHPGARQITETVPCALRPEIESDPVRFLWFRLHCLSSSSYASVATRVSATWDVWDNNSVFVSSYHGNGYYAVVTHYICWFSFVADAHCHRKGQRKQDSCLRPPHIAKTSMDGLLTTDTCYFTRHFYSASYWM
jgi:hypothetical protein